jgi:hypothetical protein
MESLEMIGWLMMGFAPSLLLMEIGCRIGKRKAVKEIKQLKDMDLFATWHRNVS